MSDRFYFDPDRGHRAPQDVIRDLAGALLRLPESLNFRDDRSIDPILEEAAANPGVTEELLNAGLTARDIEYYIVFDVVYEISKLREAK